MFTSQQLIALACSHPSHKEQGLSLQLPIESWVEALGVGVCWHTELRAPAVTARLRAQAGQCLQSCSQDGSRESSTPCLCQPLLVLALSGPVLPFQSAEVQEQSQGSEESCELTCIGQSTEKGRVAEAAAAKPSYHSGAHSHWFLWSRQIGTASTFGRGHCQQLSGDISPLAVQRPALRDR